MKPNAKLIRGDFFQILLSAHGLTKKDLKIENKERIRNALIQTFDIHKNFYGPEFKEAFLAIFADVVRSYK